MILGDKLHGGKVAQRPDRHYGRQWSLLGAGSVLVATLSHFLELKSELELLGSRQNAHLTNDQASSLWPLLSVTSDLLVSLVPSSFACDPPDDAGVWGSSGNLIC
jgi:hypothetical protein